MHMIRSREKHCVQAVVIVLMVVGLGLSGAGCDVFGGGSDPVVPEAPTGLDATSGDAEVELEWGSVEEAESYSVYRSTSTGVEASEDPLSEGVSEASYTDSEAENGTTYYYVVTAVADEEGDASSEVEVTPFADPPDRPE